MGTITILPETPKDPLALIGRRAGTLILSMKKKISNEALTVLNQDMEEHLNL